MFAYNVPVIVNGEEKVVDLISYEDMQFNWAKDYVLSGSLEKHKVKVIQDLSFLSHKTTLR